MALAFGDCKRRQMIPGMVDALEMDHTQRFIKLTDVDLGYLSGSLSLCLSQ